MKAEGTREEWKELIQKIFHFISFNRDWDEKCIEEIERRGWITKPEWEQAYNDYYNGHIDLKADKVLGLMHAHIVELEKIVREGK